MFFTALIRRDSFLQIQRKSLFLTLSVIISFKRITKYVSFTFVAYNPTSL